MTIYLIRHGQSESDVDDRYGGAFDDHLTSLGREQARKLGNKLAMSSKIQHIFCSSKLRTQETAKILKDFIKCGVEIVPDLAERNHYGILTGLTRKEAMQKYPDQVRLLKNYPAMPIGAESYNDFHKRIANAFNKICHTQYDTIAIIAHGGPIKYIFSEMTKIKPPYKLGDCCFAKFEQKENGWILIESKGFYLPAT